ncbi:MAG: hypothetical protein HFJ58_04990 [Clostridia bacterium]|nr:hypothetical protein [Clostridia bacterium]
MNSSRGVTTTNLIIYVIAMLIVIGIIATITSFFYTNVTNLEDNSSNVSEITKFNMYFLQEVKNSNNDIITVNESSITFLTGNTFTFQDNSIYMNSSKISENIKDLKFSLEEINSKKVITVLITIGENLEYTKTTKYVMN